MNVQIDDLILSEILVETLLDVQRRYGEGDIKKIEEMLNNAFLDCSGRDCEAELEPLSFLWDKKTVSANLRCRKGGRKCVITGCRTGQKPSGCLRA